MAFGLPRNSHRYFIEEVSECLHPQTMLAKRFLKFHETLQKSKKISVRVLSELSTQNLVTCYGRNLWNIARKCGKDVASSSLQNHFKFAPVPDVENWKIKVVKEILEVKWNIAEIENVEPDQNVLDELLEVLCSS